jgi:hypothetical protein
VTSTIAMMLHITRMRGRSLGGILKTIMTLVQLGIHFGAQKKFNLLLSYTYIHAWKAHAGVWILMGTVIIVEGQDHAIETVVWQ